MLLFRKRSLVYLYIDHIVWFSYNFQNMFGVQIWINRSFTICMYRFTKRKMGRFFVVFQLCSYFQVYLANLNIIPESPSYLLS